MALGKLTPIYLAGIEIELRQTVGRANGPDLEELHYIIAYHLGWEGEEAGPKARGKRIRPLLVLLTCAAASGDASTDWQRALPAAAAVELVHNFSLLHDDIEDNSPLRRGRPTVWARWGIPQAINTGDAMFVLAHLALSRLAETTSPGIALQAANVLQSACLHLTQGQYLDISYENRSDLSLEDYWPMINGKTAALLAACTELGALAADVKSSTRTAYRDFGRDLGLAFQVLDDLLGIWGDAAKIGKSNASDLVEGKKSLPVLYGLAQNGPFAQRWLEGPITPADVPSLAVQLETEGARAYSQDTADRLTRQALYALTATQPKGEAGEALMELANQLLKRRA
ncbi:MAG: polyprenyl synthetase family protein [Chloroflexota bacterium]